MGRIILTPGGPRHPLEARAPAVRDEATVITSLASITHVPERSQNLYHSELREGLIAICAQNVPSVTGGAAAAQAGPDRVWTSRARVGTG